MDKNCPNCGVRLEKDDPFCPNCGAKVKSSKRKYLIVIFIIVIVLIGLVTFSFLNNQDGFGEGFMMEY